MGEEVSGAMKDTDTYWGTAGDNWAVLLIAGAAMLVLLALAWWVRQLGRLTGGEDASDWHGVLFVGMVAGSILAALCGVWVVVSYLILLCHGWVPWWSLAVPVAGVIYGVHRVNRWALTQAKERQR